MKKSAIKTAKLLDILPEEDISIVNAIIKKLIIAWDSDFTKLTKEEKKSLEKSDFEIKNGDYVTEEEVWK